MSTTRQRYLEWRDRLSLPQLPIELWSHIFSYLDVHDLFSVRLVSRSFHSYVTQYTHFWSSVIFDLDNFPICMSSPDLNRYVRSSNINLFTKTKTYAHFTLYLRGQPS